jgi:hypothetical protein
MAAAAAAPTPGVGDIYAQSDRYRSDDELQEELFFGLRDYKTFKASACYTRWGAGQVEFHGCKADCGCPRRRLVSAAMVHEYRVELTASYARSAMKSLTKALASKDAEDGSMAVWDILQLKRISAHGKTLADSMLDQARKLPISRKPDNKGGHRVP